MDFPSPYHTGTYKSGYVVMLGLPFRAFASLPEIITFRDKEYARKNEFHVTLVHMHDHEKDTELTALFNRYVKERPVVFESFTDDVRHAVDGDGGDYSAAVQRNETRWTV